LIKTNQNPKCFVDGNFFAGGVAPIWLAAVPAHAHATLMRITREVSRVISRKMRCKAAVNAGAILLKKGMLTVGALAGRASQPDAFTALPQGA
jgi:hypothetical protein